MLFRSENGIIKDGSIGSALIHDGAITDAKIAHATITAAKISSIDADTITSGTLKTERLILTDEDGETLSIVSGLNAKAQSGEGGVLDGAIVTDKTITAAKVDVADLNAFEATIGSFDIGDRSIHSKKSDIWDPTEGIYIGIDGMAAGDGSLVGGGPEGHFQFNADTGVEVLCDGLGYDESTGLKVNIDREVSYDKGTVKLLGEACSPFEVYADGTVHIRGKNGHINFDSVTGELDVALERLTVTSNVRVDGKDVATKDGVISGVDTEFVQGDSSTLAPAIGWTTDAPAWKAGKYIWQRVKTIYQDGTVEYGPATCISGRDGVDGAPGRDGADGSPGAPGKDGVNGEPGAPGKDGADGKPGRDGVDGKDGKSPTAVVEKSGGVSVITITNSDGTVTTAKVSDGAEGTPGANGYVHVKYSDDGGKTLTGNSGEDAGKYIGVYTDNVVGDSSDVSKYTWSLIKGADGKDGTNGKDGQPGAPGKNGADGKPGKDGQDGADGVGISKITEQYYLSTSNTTQSGGSWSVDQPEWTQGKFIWTRTQVDWDDGATTYTTPVVASALNSANQNASDAAKVATNYMRFTESDGLVVGNQTGDALGGNVQLTAAPDIHLRNGSTDMAVFAPDSVSLGMGSDSARVDLVNNKGVVSYDAKEGLVVASSEKDIVLSPKTNRVLINGVASRNVFVSSLVSSYAIPSDTTKSDILIDNRAFSSSISHQRIPLVCVPTEYFGAPPQHLGANIGICPYSPTFIRGGYVRVRAHIEGLLAFNEPAGISSTASAFGAIPARAQITTGLFSNGTKLKQSDDGSGLVLNATGNAGAWAPKSMVSSVVERRGGMFNNVLETLYPYTVDNVMPILHVKPGDTVKTYLSINLPGDGNKVFASGGSYTYKKFLSSMREVSFESGGTYSEIEYLELD